MDADHANFILTVFTVVGISVLAFILFMGLRWFFTEPDNYQSKRCRENLWKVPK